MNAERVIADLRELAARTSTPAGAQRLAWGPVWRDAREWFKTKIAELGLRIETDSAGNNWVTVPGASAKTVIVGSHLDSVPNGGWLDGALGVMAALEALRMHAGSTPPVTLRLVDWADEEGARFGKSLFGSSACSGNLNMEEARVLKDKDGIALPDALKQIGVDFERVKESGKELKNAAAYLELHIEQGPVLLDLDLPLGAVLGTFGVERHAITFHGQAAHSGSTPMNRRKDAFLGAAKMSPEIYRIGERSNGGVCTIGSCTTKPGIVTSVVAECRITLDQRHLDATALAKMLQEAKAASERFAEEGNVRVSWERIWQIEPVLFHPDLIQMCSDSITETCGKTHRLPSGPLHDAAEVARSGVPTVMMFVQSLHGISHNKIEDTKEEHLELCVTAFDKLAEKALASIANDRL